MTGKKRRILGLILIFLVVIGYPSALYAADLSRGLIIRVLHAPAESYYLEVFTKQPLAKAQVDTPVFDYPVELSSPVEALVRQGWIPFHEPEQPLPDQAVLGQDFGDYREHRFYSPALSGDLLILTVLQSGGEVKTSPVLAMTMAEEIVDYDYVTGRIRPPNPILGYGLMFFSIFLPALFIKESLLGSFKIPYRSNGKVVFLTTLFSSFMVIAGSGQILVHSGRAPALTGALILVPVLLIVEYLVYRQTLHQVGKGRLVAYTATAGLGSLLLYLVTLFMSHRIFLSGF